VPSPSEEEGLSELGLWHIPLSKKPGEATAVRGTVAPLGSIPDPTQGGHELP